MIRLELVALCSPVRAPGT